MTETIKENPPQTVRIINAVPTTDEVQVAPDEKYADLPAPITPRVGIVRWIPQGDGLYRPRIQVLDNWIRVTRAAEYGIHIPSDTLVRLGNGGFIEISQPSPGYTAINLESLLRHIELCKDAEFWTPERRDRYRASAWNFRQV